MNWAFCPAAGAEEETSFPITACDTTGWFIANFDHEHQSAEAAHPASPAVLPCLNLPRLMWTFLPKESALVEEPRPGSSKPTARYIEEAKKMLERLAPSSTGGNNG